MGEAGSWLRGRSFQKAWVEGPAHFGSDPPGSGLCLQQAWKTSWRRQARPAALNPPCKMSHSAKPRSHWLPLRAGAGGTQGLRLPGPSPPACPPSPASTHSTQGQLQAAASCRRPPPLMPPDRRASSQPLRSPGSVQSPLVAATYHLQDGVRRDEEPVSLFWLRFVSPVV